MAEKVTFETGKSYNVTIKKEIGASEKAYVYEPTDKELMSLTYENLDTPQVLLWDDYIGEKILRTIWKTQEQRDELKQRWRDLKHSANAKKAARRAEKGSVSIRV